MHKEKERQLIRFRQLSEELIEALEKDDYDRISGLLVERDSCITAIDSLDGGAGGRIMNETIKKQLAELATAEAKIKKLLELAHKKMAKSVADVRKEQFVTKQYDEAAPAASGYFYDQKR